MLHLKMLVSNAVLIDTEYFYWYWCVVYNLNCTPKDVTDIPCAPNESSNQNREFLRPYVQTNPPALTQMDSLTQYDTLSNVFHQLLNDLGGPFLSTSSSMLQNVSQVMICSAVKKKAFTIFSNWPPQSDLDKVTAAQREPNSPIHTVVFFWLICNFLVH